MRSSVSNVPHRAGAGESSRRASVSVPDDATFCHDFSIWLYTITIILDDAPLRCNFLNWFLLWYGFLSRWHVVEKYNLCAVVGFFGCQHGLTLSLKLLEVFLGFFCWNDNEIYSFSESIEEK